MYSQDRNKDLFPSPASKFRSSSLSSQNNLLDLLNTATKVEGRSTYLPNLSISPSPHLNFPFQDLDISTIPTPSTWQRHPKPVNIETHSPSFPSSPQSVCSLIAHEKLSTSSNNPTYSTPNTSSQDSPPVPGPTNNEEAPAMLDSSKNQDLFAYLGVQFDSDPIIAQENALADFESSCHEILALGGERNVVYLLGKADILSKEVSLESGLVSGRNGVHIFGLSPFQIMLVNGQSHGISTGSEMKKHQR